MSEEAPRPNAVGAVVLTLVAFVTTLFGYALLLEAAGHWAALGIGITLGYGATGTLAARAVPEPAADRIGLREFAPPFAAAALLLVPLPLLTSELDNLLFPLLPAFPAPAEPPAEPDDPALVRLALLEAGIVTILLRPILEEFFFRGVIQQGVVAIHGAVTGVVVTSVLYAGTVGGLTLPFGPEAALRSVPQAAATGLLLGYLRLASGSVAVPILMRILFAGLGLASVAFAAAPEIPGFNAPGDHTPLSITLPALLSVTAGTALARRLSSN